MSIQISSDIENRFHNCLEKINLITKDVWTADISDGWQRTKKKTVIDIDACFDIIKKNEKYTILESEFEKLSIDEMMVEEFTKTYLYLSQNTVFEKSFFEDTWKVMNKKLDEPKKFYFFLGLYNFDTDYDEITIGEFKIKKITQFHFDKITSLYFMKGDEEPMVGYAQKKLKYVLEFSGLREETSTINPEEIYANFLNALRITDNGSINFGNPHSYNPDGWQGTFAPGRNDSVKDQEKYMLTEEKMKTLKENLKLLNEVKSEFKEERRRYIDYSLRRFNKNFTSKEVEDSITDLIISLESLLNRDPFEVTEKTSQRAAVLIAKNDLNECKKFIKNCYGIRSEIVHGKKREIKIKEDVKILTDEEIKNKLEEYVRIVLRKILEFQLKYKTQSDILAKIDQHIMDRSIEL